MKKFRGIILIAFVILLALAFTVPTEQDFKTFITEKAKEKTEDDALGLNDFLVENISKLIFLNAEYKDLKIGSTYQFNLGEGKDYKFVGFGTMILCVQGDLSVLDKPKK